MQNRPLGFRPLLLTLIAAACVSATASLHSALERDQNLTRLASDTSRRVAKTHSRQILLAPLEGCLLNIPLCEADEGAVRATLQKDAPNTRLIDRNDLVSQIKKHGLQEIDAFDSLVVTSIGSETGAESIVTMTLRWDGDHYEFTNRVFPDSSVDMFSTYRTRVLSEIAGDAPVLLQDPDTGAFLAVPKRRTSGLGVFQYPQCKFSEKPKNYAAHEGLYQEFRMRVTITDQGRVDQIAVLSPAPSFATEKTAESMRDAWRFTPAINSDGKPFPIRANLQIVFWQGRMTWHISY